MQRCSLCGEYDSGDVQLPCMWDIDAPPRFGCPVGSALSREEWARRDARFYRDILKRDDERERAQRAAGGSGCLGLVAFLVLVMLLTSYAGCR